MLPAIIAGAASVVPSIIKLFTSSKDEDKPEIVETVTDMVQAVTGESNPELALAKLKENNDFQLKFQEMYNNFELGIQDQLTRRHEADMKSDSVLSKNIRPLCLIFLTLTIGIATFTPPEYVSPEKFKALQELAIWVYGYYFCGRSTFDKGNVSMHIGKTQ